MHVLTSLTASLTARRQAYEDVGHSDNAEKILARFKIGELPKPPGMLDDLPVREIAAATGTLVVLGLMRALVKRLA